MTSFKSSNMFKGAWSLSSLSQYENCPRKFKYIKIDKKPLGKKSYALEYGNMVHNKLEQYLLGNIRSVPKELSKFSPELKKLKKLNAIPEEELVLDKRWEPIHNGWKNKNAWWRGKTD